MIGLEPPTTIRFGLVHGGICSSYDGIVGISTIREHRDTDAGTNRDGRTPNHKRYSQGGDDFCGHTFGIAGVGDATKEDTELVATYASDGVLLPNRHEQPLCDRAKELVSDFVAMRIVDELELVEVHKQQSETACLPA